MPPALEDPQKEKSTPTNPPKPRLDDSHEYALVGSDPAEDKLNPSVKDYKQKIPEHFQYSHSDKDAFRKKLDPGMEGLQDYPLDNEAANTGLRQQEQNPENPNALAGEDTGTRENRGDVNFRNATTPQPSGSQKDKGRFNPIKKGRNLYATIAVLLSSAALAFGIITAPAFLLVDFKEIVLNKVGDRTQSRQQARVSRIVAKQLSEDPLVAGCGTVKVRCRYKGMTDKQVTKFEERNPGTQVITENKKSVFGRNKIRSINYTENGQPKVIVAKDFVRASRTSPAFQKLIYNYNKSKVAAWWDRRAGKLFTVLHISRGKHTSNKSPPETSEEAQAQAKSDEDARKAKLAQTLTEVDSHIRKTNVFGVLCAVKSLIAESKHKAKVELTAALVVVAVGIFNVADTIKGGGATGDSGTTNQIAATAGALTAQDEFGQTGSDSYGYQYDSQGVLIKDKASQSDYQMGSEADTGVIAKITHGAASIPGIAAIATVTSALLNKKVCDIVSTPFATVVFCATQIVAAVASFGLDTAGAVIACVGGQLVIGKLVGIAEPILLKDVVKTVATDGLKGGRLGNALAGGAAAIAALDAKWHGSQPLTKAQAVKYDTFSDNAQNGGNYFGSAFDVNEPNSFAGKLVSTFLPPFVHMSSSLANFPTALSSFSMSGIANTASTVEARSVINGEYDQCNDGDYQAVGVATDPFCVPQYGLDPSMALGDAQFNKPVAALDSPPASGGFDLASLFGTPTAHAASNDTRGFTPDNRFDADAVISYMHDGSQPWIDDNGDGVSYDSSSPNGDTDYTDYIKNCLETTEPVGPDSPDMCKPKDCVASSSTSDTFRFCMFSQYAEDSGINDQLDDQDAESSNASGDTALVDSSSNGPSSLPTGNAQDLAKQIVASGKVTGGSSYYQQIVNNANGDASCYVSPAILGLILAMSQNHTLHISSLNRRCTGVLTASGTGSLHYADKGGRAVDIDIVDGHGMGFSTSTSSYDSPAAAAVATQYFNEVARILPKNAELGQINSCGLTVDTNGITDIVRDSCNHAHVGIP